MAENENRTAVRVKRTTVSAVVHRADGRVEDLGVISTSEEPTKPTLAERITRIMRRGDDEWQTAKS